MDYNDTFPNEEIYDMDNYGAFPPEPMQPETILDAILSGFDDLNSLN